MVEELKSIYRSKQRNNKHLQPQNSLKQYLPLDFSTIYSTTQPSIRAKNIETSLPASEKFSSFLSEVDDKIKIFQRKKLKVISKA